MPDASVPGSGNLAAKLALSDERWSPRIVGRFNGHEAMVAKLERAFPWHVHEDTDDFFLVLAGGVRLETEAGNVELGPGELYVVPKGVRHRPVAKAEARVLLIETVGKPNTGDPATAAAKTEIRRMSRYVPTDDFRPHDRARHAAPAGARGAC